MATCTGVRTDGTACQAHTVKDSGFCYWHDPEWRAERLQAAARGGARRTVELPEAQPLTPERARGILAAVVEAAASGAMDSGTARTVGYLLSIEARIREGSELEQRVKALEQARNLIGV